MQRTRFGFPEPDRRRGIFRAEFTGHRFPPEFPALIYGKTEGSPLFKTLRYRFVDVLYQHAFQDTIRATRKMTLAREVARALESFYGAQRSAASELAALCEVGREYNGRPRSTSELLRTRGCNFPLRRSRWRWPGAGLRCSNTCRKAGSGTSRKPLCRSSWETLS